MGGGRARLYAAPSTTMGGRRARLYAAPSTTIDDEPDAVSGGPSPQGCGESREDVAFRNRAGGEIRPPFDRRRLASRADLLEQRVQRREVLASGTRGRVLLAEGRADPGLRGRTAERLLERRLLDSAPVEYASAGRVDHGCRRQGRDALDEPVAKRHEVGRRSRRRTVAVAAVDLRLAAEIVLHQQLPAAALVHPLLPLRVVDRAAPIRPHAGEGEGRAGERGRIAAHHAREVEGGRQHRPPGPQFAAIDAGRAEPGPGIVVRDAKGENTPAETLERGRMEAAFCGQHHVV